MSSTSTNSAKDEDRQLDQIKGKNCRLEEEILFLDDILEYEKALRGELENESAESSDLSHPARATSPEDLTEFEKEIEEYEKALKDDFKIVIEPAENLTSVTKPESPEKKLWILRKFIHKKCRLPRRKTKIVYESELAEFVLEQERNCMIVDWENKNCQPDQERQATRWKIFRECYPSIFLIANNNHHRGAQWKQRWDASWSENFARLEKFVATENRLPNRTSENATEIDLYAWLKKQMTLYKRQMRHGIINGQTQKWELFCSGKLNILL